MMRLIVLLALLLAAGCTETKNEAPGVAIHCFDQRVTLTGYTNTTCPNITP